MSTFNRTDNGSECWGLAQMCRGNKDRMYTVVAVLQIVNVQAAQMSRFPKSIYALEMNVKWRKIELYPNVFPSEEGIRRPLWGVRCR